MSLFKQSISEKTLDEFDKKQTIQDIMHKGQCAFPQWKFQHFQNGNPADILIIVPIVRTVHMKVKSMMAFEREEEQKFQNIIVIDVIDYQEHLSPDHIAFWEKHCFRHYGVSDTISGLQRLKECYEVL